MNDEPRNHGSLVPSTVSSLQEHNPPSDAPTGIPAICEARVNQYEKEKRYENTWVMVVVWNHSFPQRQLRIGSNSAQPQSPAVRRSEYHRNGGERLCGSIQLGLIPNRRMDEPRLCATAIHKLPVS